jgi:hypothetical protein
VSIPDFPLNVQVDLDARTVTIDKLTFQLT